MQFFAFVVTSYFLRVLDFNILCICSFCVIEVTFQLHLYFHYYNYLQPEVFASKVSIYKRIRILHHNRKVCYYHPRMSVGNVFSHVCLSVCLSVCLFVFLSVQAITFEPLNIETSFSVCRYILTISRSSLSMKVIGSRSRSYVKK